MYILTNISQDINGTVYAGNPTIYKNRDEAINQAREQLAEDYGITVEEAEHMAQINTRPYVISLSQHGRFEAYTVAKLPDAKEIQAAYEACFGGETFIRLLGEGGIPETRWVEGSNYVDLGFVIDERTGRIVMMGALDNLVKGAAGQAVQNMNLLFGEEEDEGLKLVPSFP